MALIQVTPDLLRERAATLRNYRAEHDDVMNRMKSLIYGLNEVWKGDAQDAYVAKYDSMQGTFTNFSEMLEGYAQLMDTAANQLQETDSALSSTMNSFGA